MTFLRWRRPREASACVDIPGVTKQTVWDFLCSGSAWKQVDSTVVRAYTEPGTGPGVGERQTTIRRVDGRDITFTFEVTEMSDSHVVLQGELPVAGRTLWECRFDVEDSAGAVRVTWTERPLSFFPGEVSVTAVEEGLQRLKAHFQRQGERS